MTCCCTQTHVFCCCYLWLTHHQHHPKCSNSWFIRPRWRRLRRRSPRLRTIFADPGSPVRERRNVFPVLPVRLRLSGTVPQWQSREDRDPVTPGFTLGHIPALLETADSRQNQRTLLDFLFSENRPTSAASIQTRPDYWSFRGWFGEINSSEIVSFNFVFLCLH